MLVEHKIDSKPHFLFDSYNVAMEFLRHSDSWSLIPDCFLGHTALHPQIVFLDLPPTWKAPFTVQVICQRHRLVSHLEKAIESNLRVHFNTIL